MIHQPIACCQIALSQAIPNEDTNFLSQFYQLNSKADWQLTLTDTDTYCLTQRSTKLSLNLDFRQGNYRHRQQAIGKEPLLNAVKIQKKSPKTIIDATPGVLKDSFMLANRGIDIIAIERNPLLYVMVKKALSHFDTDSQTDNIHIDYHFGDAKDLLANFHADIIYLDPMYPPKRKSAQVKKEMQILHQVIGADSDSDELFHAAKKQGSRLVVKRPSYATPIANSKPSFSYSTDKRGATRFDIYLP